MSVPTTQEMARYTCYQQHDLTVGWVDRETRLRLLADEHQIDHELSTDLGLATLRRDRFAPHLPVDRLLNRWCLVDHDLSVMLSMRYEGGDATRPFVDVSCSTRALRVDELAPVRALAAEHYGAMTPRYVRFWSRQAAGAFPGTEADKRYLAAPVGELTRIAKEAPVTLRPAVDLRDYDRAVAAYRAVDDAHPDHPEQATIETADDLGELAADGLLFDVVLDGRWSGYVAATERSTLGLPGFAVTEWILAEEARGHGYGRWLSGLLARALLDRGAAVDAVLLGTVHNDNLGAIRAATQGARHDIGGWVRTTFDVG